MSVIINQSQCKERFLVTLDIFIFVSLIDRHQCAHHGEALKCTAGRTPWLQRGQLSDTKAEEKQTYKQSFL